MANRNEETSVLADETPPTVNTPPSNSFTRLKMIFDLTKWSPFSSREVEQPCDYWDSVSQFSSSSSEEGEGSISFPSTTTFTCDLCADDKPTDELFPIVGCDHSYCSECIAKYVDLKLQKNTVSITCPVSGCRGPLEPEECQGILPKQVFDKWCDALCESMIVGSEKFYCPFKDCSALLIDARFEDEGALECECPECHRLFCGVCRVPWHASLTCKKYQKLKKKERSNEEKQDMKLVKLAKSEKWMRCPNCRFYVQRTWGCLFIKCRCGHGFCYNCGASMVEESYYCSRCKR